LNVAAVELANDIARLQACLFRRGPGEDFTHSHPSRIRVTSATLGRSGLDPRYPRMMRPCFNKLSNALRTVFAGIAKPNPCDPPVVEAITLLMPITSPRMLINRPPLLPGLIAAFVCSRSAKKSLRFGRPLELMMPSVTVS